MCNNNNNNDNSNNIFLQSSRLECYRVEIGLGITNCLMVRRGFLALVVKRSSDGVAIKILVSGKLKTHPKSFGKIFHINVVNNGVNGTRIDDEGVAHDRCSLDQHWSPSFYC